MTNNVLSNVKSILIDDFDSEPESESEPRKLTPGALEKVCRISRLRRASNYVPETSDEDRRFADEIRKYYQNRYLLRQLSGSNPLSTFQTDVYRYVTGDFSAMSSQNYGLVYKLVEFYEYDREIDALKEKYPDARTSSPNNYGYSIKADDLKLKFIKKLYRKTKKCDRFEYWFDSFGKLPVPVQLLLDGKNSTGLRRFFENYIQTADSISVTGMVVIQPSLLDPEFVFAKILDWSITEGSVNFVDK